MGVMTPEEAKIHEIVTDRITPLLAENVALKQDVTELRCELDSLRDRVSMHIRNITGFFRN